MPRRRHRSDLTNQVGSETEYELVATMAGRIGARRERCQRSSKSYFPLSTSLHRVVVSRRQQRLTHLSMKVNQNYKNSVADIILQYTYPRIDSEVSKHRNHLLKSPFCVHPGTGQSLVLSPPTFYRIPLSRETSTRSYRLYDELIADESFAYDRTSLCSAHLCRNRNIRSSPCPHRRKALDGTRTNRHAPHIHLLPPHRSHKRYTQTLETANGSGRYMERRNCRR